MPPLKLVVNNRHCIKSAIACLSEDIYRKKKHPKDLLHGFYMFTFARDMDNTMEQLQVIQSKIYEIRGQRVMLDFDLAELYGTETSQLKRAVRRNIERFPEDFMFQLTKEEANYLMSNRVCQIGTPQYNYSAYTPFAFTEQGVAMLSSVLRSDTAIKININIMRAFVTVRQYLTSTNNPIKEIEELKQRMKALEQGSEDTIAAINDLSEDTRRELDDIYLALSQLADKQKHTTTERKPIGFAAYDKKE